VDLVNLGIHLAAEKAVDLAALSVHPLGERAVDLEALSVHPRREKAVDLVNLGIHPEGEKAVDSVALEFHIEEEKAVDSRIPEVRPEVEMVVACGLDQLVAPEGNPAAVSEPPPGGGLAVAVLAEDELPLLLDATRVDPTKPTDQPPRHTKQSQEEDRSPAHRRRGSSGRPHCCQT
jgi:hypothetical protein